MVVYKNIPAALCLTFLCIFLSVRGDINQVHELRFKDWAIKHLKYYHTTEEYYYRLGIFAQNAERVDAHNSDGRHTYTLELNRFADLTTEEFKGLYLTKPQNCSATHGRRPKVVNNGYSSTSSFQLPKSVDWREKGVVSPVKNQGECGSCWTFSTTGAMESHMAIKYGGMYNFSEQQLVDCAQAFDNHGCKGGLPSQAFEYIKYNPGLMREEDYPYTAKESGSCYFDKEKAVAYVTDIVNITQQDEHMIQDAVAFMGPVSIAFDVAGDFQLYKSGVYNSTECKTDPLHVNHAVLAVGYGTTDAKEKKDQVKYWIVKNSWGTNWGMDGYFMIEREKNMCGLADCASYPVVTKNAP